MVSENIRVVNLPLGVEQLKEFIENKELKYLVNYKNSELKGTVLFNYVSNLDLPVEFEFTDCSYEEKEEMILAYMGTRNIVGSKSLAINMANIILTYREVDTNGMLINPLFSKVEVNRFIEKNIEVLKRWELFLESTIIYAHQCIRKKPVDSVEECVYQHKYEVIDDIRYVGLNIVNLFAVPAFMELFFTAPFRNEPKYFQVQFNDYMYKGKNLYSYYLNEENTVFSMFIGHVNNIFTTQKIADLGERARADL